MSGAVRRLTRNPSDAVDAIGRPRLVEDRLCALVAMVQPEGYSITPNTILALAFWEACLTAAIQPVRPDTRWSRCDGWVVSPEICDILGRWTNEGLWSRMSRQPVAGEEVLVSDAITDRGLSLAGLPEGFLERNATAADLSVWWATVRGFVIGLLGGDVVRVANYPTDTDYRSLLLSDPAAVLLPEEEPSTAHDFADNSLSQILRHVRDVVRPGSENFEAAWSVAVLLVRRASEGHPTFGDRRFIALRKELTCEEVRSGDRVNAVFRADGVVVAEAAWEGEGDERTLTELTVAEASRGCGIGTYVLRHAQTRGCRAAFAPDDARRALWNTAGNPDGEGGYVLDPVDWGTCDTEIIEIGPRPGT